MNFYRRYVYPALMGRMLDNPGIAALREELVGEACGNVLEIGMGTGLNLPFYRKEKVKRITGIEPSTAMKPYLEQRQVGIEMEIIYDTLSNARLKPASFDTVVSTFTFCGIKNLDSFLDEVADCLKPGGCLICLEHSLSRNRFMAILQKIYQVFQAPFSEGCSVIRDYLELNHCPGLQVVRSEYLISRQMPLFTKNLYRWKAVKR